MKAFSPEMFTEQAQVSLKEDAYNLINQKHEAIESILEVEDHGIVDIMNANRQMYISLLESQKQDLGIVNEGLGMVAVIAAIIAAVVALFKKLASTVSAASTEKSILKVIEKRAEEELTHTPKKNNIPGDRKTPICINPYLNHDIQKGTIPGSKLDFSEFDRLASSTNVDVYKITFPDLSCVRGEIPEIDKLSQALDLFKESYRNAQSGWVDSNSGDKSKDILNQITKLCNEILEGVKKYDVRGSTETVSENAKEYLSKNRDWIISVDSKKGWKFDTTKYSANRTCGELATKSQELNNLVTGDEKSNKIDAEYYSAMKNTVEVFRKACTAITNTIITAYRNFWLMVAMDCAQMNDAVNKIAKLGSANEATIFENASYQNSLEAQEYMFGRDCIDESYYDEYCQNIDDTSTRFSIYMHENQMRAINEEALVFAETDISDYEKFNRLQSINEDLKNKIKRGFYNTVAALKEIFRKFMEKLTANFGTTKAYLDRYKNIILNTPFIDYQITMQNMETAIGRIEKATVPQLDYNSLAKDAIDFPTFFKQVTDKLPENGDTKIKMNRANVQTVGDANEYFKSYFCMQDHEEKLNGKWFQQHIKEFYEFLYDIRKIDRGIRDALKQIDDTVTRVTKTAGTAQQESYVYSNLYQKWFTLNENGVLVEADVKAPENPAPAGQPQGQQPAQQPTGAAKVQNIADNKDANNSNAANDKKSDVDDRLKIYTDVCSSLLKAKMSAVEFARNELMTVIRKHVQDHINAKPQAKQQEEQTKQEETPQEEPKQEAPKKTSAAQRVKNAAGRVFRRNK